MIDQGVKIDTSEFFGCGEALQLAAETGNPEVAEYLIRNGANVNVYCASSMYGYVIEAAATLWERESGTDAVGCGNGRQCARRLPWECLVSSGSLWQSKVGACPV